MLRQAYQASQQKRVLVSQASVAAGFEVDAPAVALVQGVKSSSVLHRCESAASPLVAKQRRRTDPAS